MRDVSVSGSGRRRGVGEKSKLGIESSAEHRAAEEEDEEELTPGRRVVARTRGKERLTREIDIAR